MVWPATAAVPSSVACVVVIFGAAVTVTVTACETLASLVDVAVIVAVPAAPVALNVTEVVVAPAKVVQAVWSEGKAGEF